MNKATAASPTVALRYQPVDDIALRASYGGGFQPPSLTQLVLASISIPGAAGITDPRRGNTDAGAFTAVSGGNSNLRPERSQTWAGGIIVTPRAVPGLRVSVDYSRLEKTDNIAGATAGGFQTSLQQEDLNPGRIVRGPNLPGDLPGWAGPVQLMDFTLRNIATAKLEAYDVQLDYTQATPVGTFSLFGAATYTTHYKTQISPTSPTVENVGITINNPLKLRVNAGVTWTAGNWTVGWTSYYYDSYLVSLVPSVQLNQGGNGRVPSQIYHDVMVSYRMQRQSGSRLEWLFHDLEIQFGVKNVMNKQPPLDVSAAGQLYSTLGDPRQARYFISVKKAF